MESKKLHTVGAICHKLCAAALCDPLFVPLLDTYHERQHYSPDQAEHMELMIIVDDAEDHPKLPMRPKKGIGISP